MRTARLTIAVILLFVSTASFAFATAQEGDKLRYKGEEYSIQTNPLAALIKENPDLIPRAEVMSSSLWRGYVATWSVEDGQLFLVDVEQLRAVWMGLKPDAEYRSVMGSVFPRQSRVLAIWFTGNLILPRGKLEEYVHMGYASTFESYVVLTVREGVVDEEREMSRENFETFRKQQFEAFKKTERYARMLQFHRDRGDSVESAEEFIFVFAGEEYMTALVEDEPAQDTKGAKDARE